MTRYKYPIGLQNFPEVRRGGYIYVDKTAFIHRLVSRGKYYFLSRPRRFGKSLFLSTIESYFLGRKELFENLYISRYENEWIEYPVLHLDLNVKKYASPESLDEILNEHLERWEALYGDEKRSRSLEERFGHVVRSACEKCGKQVVILVDEYDKPLLQAIDNEELQNSYRATLKAFYAVLKSMDGYIKFAMLTGVTKFGKISVFSDLNNLMDISLLPDYNEICGITEDELVKYFTPGVEALASSEGLTSEEAFKRLKEDYDGYRFSPEGEGVYNPFSLLNALDSKKFGNFWFETGTPTFLVELLKRNDYDLNNLQREDCSEDALSGLDMAFVDPVPVIYQSGYLTIKHHDKRFNTYRLGYPNREVKEGFVKFLLPYYTNIRSSRTSFEISRFVKEVEEGDIDGFMTRLQSLFSEFPYEKVPKLELHYHNVMYIVMTLMGFYVRTEYHTSSGRIDAVVKTGHYIYVMEFKLDRSAREALSQINEKGYAAPFAADCRTVIKVGAKFSSATRTLDSWIVEQETDKN